jgi:hypothetical protein
MIKDVKQFQTIFFVQLNYDSTNNIFTTLFSTCFKWFFWFINDKIFLKINIYDSKEMLLNYLFSHNKLFFIFFSLLHDWFIHVKKHFVILSKIKIFSKFSLMHHSSENKTREYSNHLKVLTKQINNKQIWSFLK